MGDDREPVAQGDEEPLLATLTDQLSPLREVRLALPRSGTVYHIVQPADLDALLDAAASDPEQNLPYWAELWPSGIALADEIVRQPELVRGREVLELGCGLGVTAIAALRAGADLLATDYAPEALALCRYNAQRNAGRQPATLRINWRQPPPELFDRAPGGFPAVLAADVLYETRDLAPLIAIFERLVAPGGLLWLAEPGRPVAVRFVAAMRERGWQDDTTTCDGPWPDPKDEGVRVTVHRFRRASARG